MLRADRLATDEIRQYAEAIDTYAEAAAELARRGRQKGVVQAHLNTGTVLEKMREFDEAIASYKKALKLDKGNFEALKRLGFV